MAGTGYQIFIHVSAVLTLFRNNPRLSVVFIPKPDSSLNDKLFNQRSPKHNPKASASPCTSPQVPRKRQHSFILGVPISNPDFSFYKPDALYTQTRSSECQGWSTLLAPALVIVFLGICWSSGMGLGAASGVCWKLCLSRAVLGAEEQVLVEFRVERFFGGMA